MIISGPPSLLEATPWAIRSPAPLLGQHSDDILSDLGLDDRRIADLRLQRAIG
jgi:formyl-CoA transferase